MTNIKKPVKIFRNAKKSLHSAQLMQQYSKEQTKISIQRRVMRTLLKKITGELRREDVLFPSHSLDILGTLSKLYCKHFFKKAKECSVNIDKETGVCVPFRSVFTSTEVEQSLLQDPHVKKLIQDYGDDIEPCQVSSSSLTLTRTTSS